MKKLLLLMTLCTSVAVAQQDIFHRAIQSIFDRADLFVLKLPHTIKENPGLSFTRACLGTAAVSAVVANNPKIACQSSLVAFWFAATRSYTPITGLFGDSLNLSTRQKFASNALVIATTAAVAPLIYTASKAGFNALLNYCRPS